MKQNAPWFILAIAVVGSALLIYAAWTTRGPQDAETRRYLAEMNANYSGRAFFLAALIPIGLMFWAERIDWFVILVGSAMFVAFVVLGVLLRRRARRLRGELPGDD